MQNQFSQELTAFAKKLSACKTPEAAVLSQIIKKLATADLTVLIEIDEELK